MDQEISILAYVVPTSNGRACGRWVWHSSRGRCFSVTEFLALISSGQRILSVGGVCHDLQMMVLHGMLSPAPYVATGTSLSPWLSQKQDACLRLEHCLVSQRSRVTMVSKARLSVSLPLRAEGSMTTHVVIILKYFYIIQIILRSVEVATKKQQRTQKTNNNKNKNKKYIYLNDPINPSWVRRKAASLHSSISSPQTDGQALE